MEILIVIFYVVCILIIWYVLKVNGVFQYLRIGSRFNELVMSIKTNIAAKFNDSLKKNTIRKSDKNGLNPITKSKDNSIISRHNVELKYDRLAINSNMSKVDVSLLLNKICPNCGYSVKYTPDVNYSVKYTPDVIDNNSGYLVCDHCYRMYVMKIDSKTNKILSVNLS